MLLDGIVSTDQGEKLDEKLANLILPEDMGERMCLNHLTKNLSDSSDPLQFHRQAQTKRHGGIPLVSFDIIRLQNFEVMPLVDAPAGVIPVTDIQKLDLYRKRNPFESPYASPLSSSPSSSDEELYSHALTLHTPMAPIQTSARRAAPPPPQRNSKPGEKQ